MTTTNTAKTRASRGGRTSSSGQVALDVRGVTKVFTKSPGLLTRVRQRGKPSKAKRIVAVDDVSFEVRRGEIFGLLGPNGTGKSTLIRVISTLLLPDVGQVLVFGLDVVQDEAEVKRLINRVSVEASFFKKLTPMENLMYAARLYRVPPRRARSEAIAVLAELGLEERSIWSPMEDMSRGMQQKVAIARAFLTSPALLLLDEPTTGLDPHSKRAVQAFVRRVRARHDTTVLLTTHDMNEADEMCDRIAIIDRGRIVALDTPTGLKGRVAREATANEKGPRGNGAEPTLEDVFLALTGREIGQDEESQP
jgi:ABC-2 type transport system ATP-binding protein